MVEHRGRRRPRRGGRPGAAGARPEHGNRRRASRRRSAPSRSPSNSRAKGPTPSGAIPANAPYPERRNPLLAHDALRGRRSVLPGGGERRSRSPATSPRAPAAAPGRSARRAPRPSSRSPTTTTRGDPRHLYGAYFGAAARARVRNGRRGRRAAGDDGGVGEPGGPGRGDAGAYSGPSRPRRPTRRRPRPPAACASSPPTARSTHGEATVVVHVGGPGTLRLSGPAVRTVSVVAEVAGNYRLAVSAKAGGSGGARRCA